MTHEKNCIVAAGKLAEIEDNILQNLVCSLKSQTSKLVFGKGNPCADIFFIGEAPGATEEMSIFAHLTAQEFRNFLKIFFKRFSQGRIV